MSLDNYPNGTVATKENPKFLTLMLTLNNFISNSRNYLQTKDCAMGTICAPSYANIFMDHFKINLIYPFIKGFSLIYLRFIEGIFFIWTGNEKDLIKFLNELNTKHESIKFKYQISKTGIIFLDTEVYIKNNNLYTKIYRKKTDRQKFVNINSEHPKSLKASIPHSQTLRIKRFCSKATDFEHHLQELKEKLVNQGYNKKSIDRQFSKVKTIDRTGLLKKTHDKDSQNTTPLFLTYNRFLPNISNIARKHWSILNISRRLQGLFQKNRLQFLIKLTAKVSTLVT